jgi:hypothetical protein
MKSGLYNIEVTAQYETVASDGPAMLMGTGGMAFINMQPAPGDYEELKAQTEMLEKINKSQTMKEHERIFFALCYNLRHSMKPRAVVNLLAETIPHRRCWYYLRKWGLLGFYDFGVTEDLGWFEIEKIPPRYMEIVKED